MGKEQKKEHFFGPLALSGMRFAGLSRTLDSENLPSCFCRRKVAFKKSFLGYVWLLLFELADAPRPRLVTRVLAGLGARLRFAISPWRTRWDGA